MLQGREGLPYEGVLPLALGSPLSGDGMEICDSVLLMFPID
jgi:hypothetical protein